MHCYRVIVHAHSLWSYDGTKTLGELSRLFSPFANILMMTEHSQRFSASRFKEYQDECSDASTQSLRILPGMEYSTEKNEIHILTWGINEYLGEELRVETILAKVAQAKGVAILAHPGRREIWKKYDHTWTNNLYGIELWNRKTDGLSSSRHAEKLLQITKLNAIASLDFHEKNQIYPLYNILRSNRPISEMTNSQIIELIRSTTLYPRFAGLPIDSRKSQFARKLLSVCERIDDISLPIRRMLKMYF